MKHNPAPTTQQTPKNNPKQKYNPNHNPKVVHTKQPTTTQNKKPKNFKSSNKET
jgi:hypothetical protein